MAQEFEVIKVGKWSVARVNKTGEALIRFSFSDLPDQNFIMSNEAAGEIGRALVELTTLPRSIPKN
jgi:hypothetical protein